MYDFTGPKFFDIIPNHIINALHVNNILYTIKYNFIIFVQKIQRKILRGYQLSINVTINTQGVR
jgi:hypothetical protein